MGKLNTALQCTIHFFFFKKKAQKIQQLKNRGWKRKKHSNKTWMIQVTKIAVFSPKFSLIFDLWLSKEIERLAWFAWTSEAPHSLVRPSRLSLRRSCLYRLRAEATKSNTPHRRWKREQESVHLQNGSKRGEIICGSKTEGLCIFSTRKKMSHQGSLRELLDFGVDVPLISGGRGDRLFGERGLLGLLGLFLAPQSSSQSWLFFLSRASILQEENDIRIDSNELKNITWYFNIKKTNWDQT